MVPKKKTHCCALSLLDRRFRWPYESLMCVKLSSLSAAAAAYNGRVVDGVNPVYRTCFFALQSLGNPGTGVSQFG